MVDDTDFPNENYFEKPGFSEGVILEKPGFSEEVRLEKPGFSEGRL